MFSKTAYKISLYRSPSQINNNVNDFLLTFEQSLSDTTFWNPDHFFVTGENDSINFGGNSTGGTYLFSWAKPNHFYFDLHTPKLFT